MARFNFICLLLFVNGLQTDGAISNERLCADTKCSSRISVAEVLINYMSSEDNILSMRRPQTVVVYSKEAGNRRDLWGVEINGIRGYVPKNLIREIRVYIKTSDLKHIVPTEESTHPAFGLGVSAGSSLSGVTPPIEVVEGTTIFLNPDGESQPVEPTAVISNTQPSVEQEVLKSGQAEDKTEEENLDEEGSGEEEEEEGDDDDEEEEEEEEEEEYDVGESEKNENKTSTLSTEDLDDSAANNKELLSNSAHSDKSNERADNEVSTTEPIERVDNTGNVSLSPNIGPNTVNDPGLNEVDNANNVSSISHIDSNEADGTEPGVETINRSNVSSATQVGLNEANDTEANEGADNMSNVSSADQIGLNESNDTEPNEEADNMNKVSSADQVGLNEVNDTEVNQETDVSDASSIEVHTAEPNKESDSLSDVNSSMSSTEVVSSTAPDVSNEVNTGSADGLESSKVVINESDVSSNLIKEEEIPFGRNGALVEEQPGNEIDDKVSIPEEQSNMSKSEESPSTSEETEESQQKIEIQGEVKQEVFSELEHVKLQVHSESEEIMEGGDNDIGERVNKTPVDLMEEEYMEISRPEEVTTESSSDPILEDPYHEAVEQNTESNTEDYHEAEKVLTESNAEDSYTETEETYPGTFFSGFMKTVFSLFGSHDADQDDHLISVPHQAADVCEADCETGQSGLAASSQEHKMPVVMEEPAESLYALPFLIVTAVSVLLFTLGYYYIEKSQRVGSLLAKINRLEKALLASAKDNSCLQESLEDMKERLTSTENSTSSKDVITVLEQELEECQIARRELEEEKASLEKELDTATETGLELNRMLSEFLSSQHGSDTLMKSVEQLQKQLDNQKGTIASMNSSLSAKSMENEILMTDLNLAEERIKGLEEELNKVTEALSNLKKEKDDMEHEFLKKNQSVETQLMEALESKSAESQRMDSKLKALQEVLDEMRCTIASRDSELEVLRDCLGGDVPSVQLEQLADVGRARAELASVSQDRDSLKERLEGEEEARNLLEDHVRIVSEEVESLRIKYRDAENAKVEAQTRLDVLSNYFKEKETQLQKELGLQEAMYVQKEGDAISTVERIRSLQEEVENYKSQNESLKKEILDQERGLKAQIATLEKKAHENWVVARQAERRLEETKQENGQLRNRLTLVERNILNSSDTPKVNDRHPIESNGEHPTSPLPLGLADLQELPGSPLHYGHPASPPLLPPSGQPPVPPPPLPFPPGLFLPPPPHGLPFLPPLPPGDRRPPPLGRMSSPPPSPYDRSPPRSPPRRSYRSPPPRYDRSPERSRYQHRSSSPHRSPYSAWDEHHGPPRSSFRPLRRDSPHEPKGSALSSGHSSESLDKSSRHSGRL